MVYAVSKYTSLNIPRSDKEILGVSCSKSEVTLIAGGQQVFSRRVSAKNFCSVLNWLRCLPGRCGIKDRRKSTGMWTHSPTGLN
jgi:hypothetical protein